jgi:hypothetical protein
MRELPARWVERAPRRRYHTEAFEARAKVPVLPWQEPGTAAVPGFFGRMARPPVGQVVVMTGADGLPHTAVVYHG